MVCYLLRRTPLGEPDTGDLGQKGATEVSRKELGSSRTSPRQAAAGCTRALWYSVAHPNVAFPWPSPATSSHLPCAVPGLLSLKTLVPLPVAVTSCCRPLPLLMVLTVPAGAPLSWSALASQGCVGYPSPRRRPTSPPILDSLHGLHKEALTWKGRVVQMSPALASLCGLQMPL